MAVSRSDGTDFRAMRAMQISNGEVSLSSSNPEGPGADYDRLTTGSSAVWRARCSIAKNLNRETESRAWS
jgi:hypothetical protein